LDFYLPKTANGKSLIEGCGNGFVKIIYEKTHGKVLGVHILAPHASEMLTQCTAAIRYHVTTRELEEIIYPHPSVSELIAEAIYGANGKPLHA
jgi:dihydrolipoamide dehydrogenase